MPRRHLDEELLPRGERQSGPEGAQKSGDGEGGGGVDRRPIGDLSRLEQAAVMEFAARQSGELLGGEPRIGDLERAGSGGAAQEGLDLRPRPLRAGLPEDLGQRRKAGDLADDDAVERDRFRRQDRSRKRVAIVVSDALDVARDRAPRPRIRRSAAR